MRRAAINVERAEFACTLILPDLPLEYRRVVSRVLAAAGLLLSLPAHAADAPREPTGKWVVDFAEHMCVLQRDYGTADKPLLLAFSPRPMGEGVSVYVFEPRAKRGPRTVPAKIGFGPGLPTKDTNLLSFDMRQRPLRSNETGISRSELERAAATEQISIAADKTLDVAFKLPELSRALMVLDECVVDLFAHWGLSREQQQAIAKRAELVKPMHLYVNASDYPDAAIRRDESGINSARFTVQKDGRTSNCTIVQSSGSRSLDRALCRVVGRFRYRPALDQNGQAIDSLDFVQLRWWVM